MPGALWLAQGVKMGEVPEIVVAAILLAGLWGVAYLVRRYRAPPKSAEAQAPKSPAPREPDATIIETVKMTPLGRVSVVLLVIAIFIEFVGFAGAPTVFQQIEAGVGLVASAMVFGLGIIVGRKRTFTVYRQSDAG